ncbi:MAG: hypothetical protein HY043_17790 [Verrucomicrobia bacterium]|nr:hypothetical protein [Verrucomicrobiota bacterium]
MKLRRLLAWSGLALLAVLALVALIAGGGWWYFHPEFTRANGIVYGTRHGHDLRLDVARPVQAKGLGVPYEEQVSFLAITAFITRALTHVQKEIRKVVTEKIAMMGQGARNRPRLATAPLFAWRTGF